MIAETETINGLPGFAIRCRWLDGVWKADFGKDEWKEIDPQPTRWCPLRTSQSLLLDSVRNPKPQRVRGPGPNLARTITVEELISEISSSTDIADPLN